jgi:hypothetical protein
MWLALEYQGSFCPRGRHKRLRHTRHISAPVLWLTLLAPDIVEAILDRQPPTLQLDQLFNPITPSTRMRES